MGIGFQRFNPAGVLQLIQLQNYPQAALKDLNIRIARSIIGIPMDKTFDNGKTSPARPPSVSTILIGAARISFSGHERIVQTSGRPVLELPLGATSG